MRERYGALLRRAAAAVGVSVALHVVVVSLVGSVLLGSLWTAITDDATPLVVEVVTADARPVARPARARPARNGPTRSELVSLPPPIPIVAEDEPPLAEPPAHADVAPSGVDAVSEPSAPIVSETIVAGVSELEPAENRLADEPSADGAEPRVAALGDDSAAPLEQEAAVYGPEPPTSAPAPGVSLAQLDEVRRNPSVSAHAEGQPFVGRREVFEFLLDHPDFATHISRALRLARYRMWRTDEGLFVDDGWGATGRVFVVYAASGTRVLYARGEFQHGLLPTISGEAVVTINYEVQPAADGRDLLSAAISSRLKIGGALGDLVARLAGSLATEKAEKESRRLVRTFARVLQAVDEKPAAVYASLRERPDVPQRELEQFRVLLKLP